jgi:multiple sugar transport system permease protein
MTFENYREIVRFNPTFFLNMWNSVQVTVYGVALTLVAALGAAFVFSRMHMGWLRLPAVFIIAIRMFPPIVVIIPLFPLMNALGLLDTLTPLVVAGAAFGVSIATLLLKAFIDDIPVELEEAALIDGATRWQVFRHVALPIAKPGIAVSFILAVIFSWNNFVFGIVLAGRETRTLPVAVYNMISFDQLSWGPLAAAALVVTLPVLLLTVFAQRQNVAGLTAGAVKGG